jgi:hypothetical protein
LLSSLLYFFARSKTATKYSFSMRTAAELKRVTSSRHVGWNVVVPATTTTMETSSALNFRPSEHAALRTTKGEVEEDQLKAESKEACEQRRKNIRKPGLSVTCVVVEGECKGKLAVGCAWHEIAHLERAGAVDSYFV